MVPAPARAGLTALVLAASAALLGARSTDSAQAQTAETTPSVDEAPQMVAPDELDDELADEDEKRPEADDQGRADSRAGALKGGSYVVKRGDSLWGIARANLGGSPSNARVAGEVERLWSLNNVAIGTGDPDLIYAGQRLKLR